MATFTQTRSLLPNAGQWKHWFLGTLKGSGKDPLIPGNQVTTSWRTIPGYSKEETDVGEREFRSHTDFVRALREEYVNRFDTGHEFQTEKYEVVYDNPLVDIMRVGVGPDLIYNRYAGYIYPSSALIGKTAMSAFNPSSSTINVQGAKAIAATIPTSPEAGLAQFLGELREKLPTLVGVNALKKGYAPKRLGEEHLNLEFGLKPVVSDIKKLASAAARAHYLIDELKRNSGLNKRYSTQWTVDSDTTIIAKGSPSNPVIRQWSGNTDAQSMYWYSFTARSDGTTIIRDVENSSKFVGAYTYHLAEAHDFLTKLQYYEQLANSVLGADFNVDTVWELTPWSWLIDWFADVGTFISNVTALSNDSLVLRYGYMLNTTRVRVTHSLQGIQPNTNWVGVPSSCSMTEIYTRKKRTKATPYGFGVDLGGLSPRRWAILGALGLTKSPGALR